mmetsp:Transcript_58813/g.167237  ORF Transcript_58813/g.167237 Transcript_58813/m.167237 type:complete len:292 (-) Transcript_58813:302-1177(-)
MHAVAPSPALRGVDWLPTAGHAVVDDLAYGRSCLANHKARIVEFVRLHVLLNRATVSEGDLPRAPIVAVHRHAHGVSAERPPQRAPYSVCSELGSGWQQAGKDALRGAAHGARAPQQERPLLAVPVCGVAEGLLHVPDAVDHPLGALVSMPEEVSCSTCLPDLILKLGAAQTTQHKVALVEVRPRKEVRERPKCLQLSTFLQSGGRCHTANIQPDEKVSDFRQLRVVRAVRVNLRPVRCVVKAPVGDPRASEVCLVPREKWADRHTLGDEGWRSADSRACADADNLNKLFQ